MPRLHPACVSKLNPPAKNQVLLRKAQSWMQQAAEQFQATGQKRPRRAGVLVETLRRVGLTGTELASAQVGTIRLRLLKIGGRIVRSVRRVVVHLASSFPLADLLRGVLKRLQEWRCLPTAGP